MSFRFKLVSSFIVFVVVPLILLGSIAFFISKNMLEQKYSQLNKVTMESVTQNVNTMLDEVNQLSVATIANPMVQQILSKNTTNMTSSELNLNTISVEQTLSKVLYTYPFIYSVRLYDNNGVLYKVGQYDMNSISYQSLIKGPIYQDVLKKDGKPIWIGPYRYPSLTGNASVLTEIRLVKNVNTLQNQGLLILQTKLSGLMTVLNEVSPNEQFMLANKDGMIFYDNHQKYQGTKLAKILKNPITLSTSYRTFNRTLSGKENLISVNGLSIKNWRLLSIQSWQSLSHDIIRMGKLIALIMTISLIGALLFLVLFVNRLSDSIIDVVKVMKKVEGGDLDARVKLHGDGEIKQLTEGFNQLVSRIKDLIDEVKFEQKRKNKAEMMLLEAQIRPHFLFNTLESINALAIQNEGKKVSQMIYQLGRILRISIESDEEITVREEIEHLKSYLAIQKYRFEDLFDYEISIPEQLLNHSILKLVLQPLAENALQHAFKDMKDKGFLKITGVDAGDHMDFFVEDNGIGFAEETLLRLQEKEPPNTVVKESIGIKNVADRIRIHYGKSYGLMICSDVWKGSSIKCTIPKS